MILLTLLTRESCALCEEFKNELIPLLDSLGKPWQLVLQDVDTDATLQRRFGMEIPVLLWASERVAAWPLEPAKVLAILQRIPT